MTIPADGTTTATLRFNIANPNAGTSLTNITFTDTLPAGLVVATPNGLLGSCGPGVITATAGSNTIRLTGGALQPSGGQFPNCSFVVNVVSPVGTAPALLINNTTTITATAGNTPVSSNGATAQITVAALTAPALTKAFAAPFIEADHQ